MSRALALVVASACLVACPKPTDRADPAPTPSAPNEPPGEAPAKEDALEGLEVGQQAPDFEVKDEAGNTVRLSQHRGKQAVLLAFYPKDFTGG